MPDATIAAAGRLLLAILFLLSGLSKLAAPEATIGYIASAGLPFPFIGYVIALGVELGGGVLLLTGFHARITAAIMGAFTIAAAVAFHSNFADQNEMIHFLKNVALAGGLLQVVAFGAGRFQSRCPPRADCIALHGAKVGLASNLAECCMVGRR